MGGRGKGRWASFGLILRSAALVSFLHHGTAAHAADDSPSDPSPPVSALDADHLKLRGLEDSLQASETRRQALDQAIATYRSDRARFQSDLIDTTRRVGEAETGVAAAESRLRALEGEAAAARKSLDGRRAVIVEVLAVLQRMGRHPPPALLVDPQDVLKAIRTSMLLGAVLPGMRDEIDALTNNLEELTRTRKAIESERAGLASEHDRLVAERQRLSALVDARQAALAQAETDVTGERDKAKQLAAQAGSLKDLIARMEREGGAAGRAAEEAKRSDEKLAALAPNGIAPGAGAGEKDPARLAPAIAFASTKGLLPLPASGTVLRQYGEDDGLGSTEKGVLIGTGKGAVVTAPADSWIAYAGPYRSFGQLLILNAGGGYYIVLAGMDRVNVSLGQFVLAGEPVAVMGDGSTKSAAAMALGAQQPVLYVEFRKDGATIDPGPWWAKPEIQKVRG